MYDTMIEKMIQRFGFEDIRTINFIDFCENAGTDDVAFCMVYDEFNTHMKESIFIE